MSNSGTATTWSYLVGCAPAVGSPTIATRADFPTRTEQCDDFIGNPTGVNGFALTRREIHISRLGGERSGSCGVINSLNGWVPSAYRNIDLLGSLGSNPSTSVQTYVQRGVARSNPNRPIIQLPVTIAEFRDIPRLIRYGGDWLNRLNPRSGHRGNLARFRDVPDSYLAWVFGIKPLISDMFRMMDFVDKVNKRIDAINRMANKGGLRRKRVVYTNVDHESTNVVVESTGMSGGTVTCRRTGITVRRKWVTCRWVPIGTPVRIDSPKERDEFIRLMLGFGRDPASIVSNAWEAMPWSWLIDWFGTVGDFIQAHGNAIPTQPTRICLMQSAETKYHWGVISKPSWVSGGGASAQVVSKQRVGSSLSPLPTVDIPFLTGSQLSILAAIGSTRKMRFR